jgi:hypothetical protein
MRDGAEVGLEAKVFDMTPYSLSMMVFTDVFAPLGTADLLIESTDLTNVVSSLAPGVLDVQPRSAEPLEEPGTSEDFEPGDTFLYTFDAAGPSQITFTMVPDSVQTLPLATIMPASGAFADALPSNLVLGAFALDKESWAGSPSSRPRPTPSTRSSATATC